MSTAIWFVDRLHSPGTRTIPVDTTHYVIAFVYRRVIDHVLSSVILVIVKFRACKLRCTIYTYIPYIPVDFVYHLTVTRGLRNCQVDIYPWRQRWPSLSCGCFSSSYPRFCSPTFCASFSFSRVASAGWFVSRNWLILRFSLSWRVLTFELARMSLLLSLTY